jgi:hypothetical protein
VIENPTLDVEVACAPEIARPRIVVVPKPLPETVRALVDVVAVPATVVVERKRSPPAFLNVHWRIPAESDRASCGTVDVARVNCDIPFRYGDVVPTPRLPKKYDVAVVVESNDPTVSCDDVAIRLPVELVVMIELIGNVVAVNTCEASVDVETVETIPLDPVNV